MSTKAAPQCEATRAKPAKPYPDFPLTPHGSGKWAKKVRGHLYYFGRWNDPDGALREWNAAKDALLAGRSPTVTSPDTIILRDLFNRYLDRQLARVDAGRLEPRSYMDSKKSLLHFARVAGPARLVADLGPGDFRSARADYATGKGPHTLNRYLVNVRAVFNWAIRNAQIHKLPVYGDEFAVESIRVRRRAARENRYARGADIFSSREIRAILQRSKAPLKAMILLGINAGFYAVDVASLPLAAIDLDDAWLEFPRIKTEVMRAAPLWPETVKALREAIPLRGSPLSPADNGLAFLTPTGRRWVSIKTRRENGTITGASRTDRINKELRKLLESIGIRRKGINFAALRDTFSTLADELPDENAALLIRGHAFPGMDAFYVKSIARPRLEKITEHVRRKLLNPKVIRSSPCAKSPRRRHKRSAP